MTLRGEDDVVPAKLGPDHGRVGGTQPLGGDAKDQAGDGERQVPRDAGQRGERAVGRVAEDNPELVTPLDDAALAAENQPAAKARRADEAQGDLFG